MQITKTSKTLLLGLLLSVGLSACDSMKVWRADKPEPCPRISVLDNASKVTKFKDGPGRDLIDVVFEGEITNILNLCKYDVDYDSREGTIHTQIAAVIAAKRGPADTARSASIPYFVAVVDAKKNIIQKNIFNLKLAFPGNLTQNEVTDEMVDLTIPVTGGLDGNDFEIYIGLQLSREEMAYNQRQSQR
jgi:hypothetical protein